MIPSHISQIDKSPFPFEITPHPSATRFHSWPHPIFALHASIRKLHQPFNGISDHYYADETQI